LFFYEARPRFQETVQETTSTGTFKPRFVATKWESIDPTQVAAQGIVAHEWHVHVRTILMFTSGDHIQMGLRS
jgi:hypothetical protein